MNTTGDFDKKADQVFEEIKETKSILLHCHPLPDPDSVGSVLAMKFALEQLGKKATVIRGDSEIPQAFMHFPGANSIVQKNFSEIDLAEFDLFIILDSGSREMISQIQIPVFPLPLKTIVIDHHMSNLSYGDINILDFSSPATAYILYKLFERWNISFNHDIALNLFIGIYSDTGGFKYFRTDYNVLEAVASLAKLAPDFTHTIFTMENSNTRESIYFQALALNSVQTFLDENIAISAISYKDLTEKNIPEHCIHGNIISNLLKSVVGWNIGISMIERKPNKIKISARTRDSKRYDISKLMIALGGGGHKDAGGTILSMPLPEAIKKVVETAKIIYNL